MCQQNPPHPQQWWLHRQLHMWCQNKPKIFNMDSNHISRHAMSNMPSSKKPWPPQRRTRPWPYRCTLSTCRRIHGTQTPWYQWHHNHEHRKMDISYLPWIHPQQNCPSKQGPLQTNVHTLTPSTLLQLSKHYYFKCLFNSPNHQFQ